MASLWIRGDSGKAYFLGATQDSGFARARLRSFVTTGDWQRVTVKVTLRAGDTVLHLTVFRPRRGGEESFLVDDVRVISARR